MILFGDVPVDMSHVPELKGPRAQCQFDFDPFRCARPLRLLAGGTSVFSVRKPIFLRQLVLGIALKGQLKKEQAFLVSLQAIYTIKSLEVKTIICRLVFFSPHCKKIQI